jgi:hypothetical protein
MIWEYCFVLKRANPGPEHVFTTVYMGGEQAYNGVRVANVVSKANDCLAFGS